MAGGGGGGGGGADTLAQERQSEGGVTVTGGQVRASQAFSLQRDTDFVFKSWLPFGSK